jgi:hypothetical protein
VGRKDVSFPKPSSSLAAALNTPDSKRMVDVAWVSGDDELAPLEDLSKEQETHSRYVRDMVSTSELEFNDKLLRSRFGENEFDDLSESRSRWTAADGRGPSKPFSEKDIQRDELKDASGHSRAFLV